MPLPSLAKHRLTPETSINSFKELFVNSLSLSKSFQVIKGSGCATALSFPLPCPQPPHPCPHLPPFEYTSMPSAFTPMPSASSSSSMFMEIFYSGSSSSRRVPIRFQLSSISRINIIWIIIFIALFLSSWCVVQLLFISFGISQNG